MPDASKTSALTRAAGSPSPATISTPSPARIFAAAFASRPSPPSATRPSMSPGPRSSSIGCGSPIRLVSVPATGSRVSCAYRSLISLLQDRDDALPTGRADADRAPPAAALVELLGQRGDDPPAG